MGASQTFAGTDGKARYQRATARLTTALREHHSPTHEHSMRVEFLAGGVARRLGLAADLVAVVELVAIVHDVGKLAVPAELLSKPGALSETEYALVKTHSVRGEELLVAATNLDVGAEVRGCHERWDGSGYPDGLVGEQIPLASRIVGACDALDAMLSSRSYRRALTLEEAIPRLRAGAGGQFDPAVVDALLSALADPPWPADEALDMLILIWRSGDRGRYERMCRSWLGQLEQGVPLAPPARGAVEQRLTEIFDSSDPAGALDVLAETLADVGARAPSRRARFHRQRLAGCTG